MGSSILAAPGPEGVFSCHSGGSSHRLSMPYSALSTVLSTKVSPSIHVTKERQVILAALDRKGN